MRRALALACLLVACGARTGLSEPPPCDVATDCPEAQDFCGSLPACLAARCGFSGVRSCDDDSVCTNDSCDGAARTCVHTLRDRDGDHFADGSCGGDDCDDHDPAAHPGASERCSGGVDEDCDGRFDCSDSDCAGDPSCAMCAPELCTGGIDEDCDHTIDCADADCEGRPPCCAMTETLCDDGRDDDCDGRIDCLDADCAHAPSCCVPHAETCNGVDDDCDGTIDDGVPCFFLDGASIHSVVSTQCGEAWYAYGHPDSASNNAVPDVRRRGEVVVAIVESPESCGGNGVAVIDDRPGNGSGGMLRARFTVTPAEGRLLQSDDPSECSYDGATGIGSCDWHWEPCCTDGMIVGAFAGDFCMSLTLSAPTSVTDVIVLDGASSTVSRGFTTMMLCQRTVPEVP